MTPESLGPPLDRNDPADAPRCPMEALVDRFNSVRHGAWLDVRARRTTSARCYATINVNLKSLEQLDGLINFLQEVRG